MFYRFKQLTLVAGDFIALMFGLLIATAVRFRSVSTNGEDLISPMLILFFFALVILFISGLYDLGRTQNRWIFFKKIITACVIWFIFGITFFYLRRTAIVSPKTILFFTAIFGFSTVAIWRYIYNRFISTELWKIKVVFVGLTPEVGELIEIINNEPSRGYQIVGFIIGTVLPVKYANYPHAATFKNLMAQNGNLRPDIIVISPSSVPLPDLQKELYSELTHQISIKEMAKFYSEITGRIPPFTFSESWFLSNLNEQDKKIYDRFRIIVDYVCATIMSIGFAVTFPFIATAIKLTSPGKIFFKQERIGRLGKIFKIYKYRTMSSLSADGSAETNGPQFAAAGDSRITKVGKFLRRSRLDELPQFINIFKNEMAIIGPRPERPEFVAQLSNRMPFYLLRHLIKPGLTGWAQVKESYYGTIDENLRKLEYDLFYIMKRDIWLDISIILRTIGAVVKLGGR